MAYLLGERLRVLTPLAPNPSRFRGLAGPGRGYETLVSSQAFHWRFIGDSEVFKIR